MEELGRTLKAAREEKGITLAQVSEITKIHRRHLEAIEEGAFDRLPGPVYVKAFLRHYARAVGLDPEYVIDQYRQLAVQGGEDPQAPAEQGLSSVTRYRERRRQRAMRRAQRLRQVLVVILLLLLAAAGTYWVIGQRKAAEPSFGTGADSGVDTGSGVAAGWGAGLGAVSGAGTDVAPGAAQSTEIPAVGAGIGDIDGVEDVVQPALPADAGFALLAGDGSSLEASATSPGGSDPSDGGGALRLESLPSAGRGESLSGPDGPASAESTVGIGRFDVFARDATGASVSEPENAATFSDLAVVGSPTDSAGLTGLEILEAVEAVAAVAPAERGERPAESLAVPGGEIDPGDEAVASGPAPGVVLQVQLAAECWFDVIADGRRIFMGTLQAGEEATWVAKEVLQVRFGRPEGVFLTLNGQPLGRAGTGVITREFRRDGTG